MNWQQTIYWVSDMADLGFGWEDIKAKMANAGTHRIPDNELRAFVLGKKHPQASVT